MHTPHFRPPKINWKLYLTRKVFLLIAVVVVTSYAEEYFHMKMIGRFHEFGLSFLAEHLLFGIPLSGD